MLHAALDATERGSSPVVMLHGEAGVGKTRTVRRFAHEAGERGAAVLWGSCEDGVAALPYNPWGEAIDGHLDGLKPGSLTELPDAATLSALSPTLRRALANGSGAPPPPDPGVPGLSEAVAGLLDSVAEPVVLVLDDLQWASPAALEMFCYVARRALAPMIIAIYRGRELDISYPLARCLGEVNRRRPTTYVRLDSLSRTEADELLEHAAGGPMDPKMADAIYESTRGNPFFLGELAGEMQSSDGAPGAPGWRAPERIKQAVAFGIAGLSAPARDMLESASVFAADFGFEELRAVTGLDEDFLLRLLDEALVAEVLSPAEGERYEFTQAIVRLTLYGRFSPSRRTRLHRAAAEAIERAYAGHVADAAPELARQYHRSITLPGAERGLEHAMTACELARRAHRPVDAVEFARMAVDLGAGEDPATRVHILERLALAQAAAGNVADAERCLEAALSLASASDASAETVASLVYGVVSALRITVPHQAGLEPLIERGLTPLGNTRDIRWARLKLLERPHEPAAAGAFHALRWNGLDPEAVRIARAKGDDDDYPRTIDWHSALSGAELEQILARAHTWEDPAVKLPALIAAAHHMLLSHGPTPDVERLCAQSEALAEQLGSVAGRAAAAIQRTMILGEEGRFAEAGARVSDAATLAESLGPESQLSVVAAIVGELTAEHVTPDWARAGNLALDAAANAEPLFWGIASAAYACHAFAHAGMEAESRELLAQVVDTLVAGGLAPYTQSIAFTLAASAVSALGSGEHADVLFEYGQGLNGDDWYMSSRDLAAARLATVLGDREEAADRFQRARETFTERRQAPLRAIVDYQEAVSRHSLRQPGASGLLRTAAQQFADLGMTAWSARVAEAQGAGNELPDELTPREAEVLRLVSTGSTNNEIADALVLSVHTVERHLTNTYRKIGARNRADAAGYVLRHDL